MAREVDDRLGRELKLEKDALRVIQRSAPLLAERGVEVEGEMDPGRPSPLKHARRFARIGLVARQRISAA